MPPVPKKMDLGNFDFDQKPFLVCWETTNACDLACVHCRASAQSEPAPDELNFEESMRLVREVHGMGTPILVFTGGDPLKKKRLDDLIRYGKSLGLKTGTVPDFAPVVASVTAGVGLIMARDNDKTSEDVGAGVPAKG